MKTLFLNHKYQASYITFIVFIPLLFVIFYSNDFFKMEIKNEDSFSLAIKQFTQTNPTNETKPTESVGGKIKCRKRKIKCRIFATNYLSFNLKLKL
ncbi:hypothetical protein FST54_02790 [Campylobacter jejuni]|nr:hypothetical protein [Campylobacter jejuni]